MRRYLPLIFTLLSCSAWAGSFEDGVAAFTNQKYDEAAKHFTIAAEEGNAHAQFNLGLLYANGRGVAQDDAVAVMWYRKSADQGNPLAQGNLAYMLSNGLGTQKNEEEAIEWYRKASNQGSAVAQANLGMRYLEGRGVPQDQKLAIHLLQQAALQGLPVAKQILRQLYGAQLGLHHQQPPKEQPIGMGGQ